MFFKQIPQEDVIIAKDSINEHIPINSAIFSGAYGTYPNDTNVLKYTASHGLFESVYDYPYLSSSANHICDITFGTRYGATPPTTSSAEKYRIYQQKAQSLLGFDATGSVRNFELNGTVVDNMFFINFSRLLVKDGIMFGSLTGTFAEASDFTDLSGSNTADSLKIDSPAGQYGYIYRTDTLAPIGLLFYQQGVMAISPNALGYSTPVGTITEIADSLRQGLINGISFSNMVQINSSIYTCTLKNNEFNYSSNPTYTSGSNILVKPSNTSPATTYITTIGLYDSVGNLTAVAKLSHPLKKTQADTVSLRVRLDY